MSDPPSRSSASAVANALDGAWSPIRQRMQDLTAEEYLWEPASGCWTIRRVGEDWIADWEDPDPVPAPLSTIAWRCWHIAVDCLDSYSARLFGRTGSALAGRRWVADPASAIAQMDLAWQVFATGVEGWDDDALLEALGPDWGPYAASSNLDLVFHALREVIHHGAEIALLRDLHLAQRHP